MEEFDAILNDFESPQEPPMGEVATVLAAAKGKKEQTFDLVLSEQFGDEIDIRAVSPEDLQVIAVRNLVVGSMSGDVQASKALMAFTEDASVSDNEDLFAMSASELAGEARAIAKAFEDLMIKEATSQ